MHAFWTADDGPEEQALAGVQATSLAGVRIMLRDVANAARDVWRNLAGAFDPYRPELHYMRGPGPKWHAKRDAVGNLPTPLPTEGVPPFLDIADLHA
jgi:hypothetical protein